MGVLPIIGIYKQLILGEKLGDNPMSDISLLIFSIIMFSLVGLFLIMKLKTSIDKNGINMYFFPFIKKSVDWQQIKNVKVINYGFVGGWGIRLWTKYGTVYNVKGDKGLEIVLKSGKKFLIGTQKETELSTIIEEMMVGTKV